MLRVWRARRGRRAVFAFLAVALTAISSLAVSTASGAKVGDGQTLNALAVDTDWVNFDFQAMEVNQDTNAVAPAYATLVAFGPTFKIEPYLASSWKVTPANRPTSITFTLKTGVACANGVKLTAADVAASFQRLFTVTKVVNLISSNLGAGPFTVSSNSKQNTVTIKTATADRELLQGFAWPGASVICPAGLAAVKANPTALQTQMYGAGPYTMVSSTHADQIQFALRPGFTWGPPGTSESNLPSTLVLKYVADPSTVANLLLTGGLQIGQVAGPAAAPLTGDSSLKVTKETNWSIGFISFNMTPGHVMADPKLREAFEYAFSNRAYNQVTAGGAGILTPSVLAPGEPCFDPKTLKLALTPSLTKAAQILAADGYTLTGGKLMKNGQQLTLHLTGFNFENPAGGDYVVSQLNTLGIAVNMDSPQQYSQDAVTGNYDAGFIGGESFTPNPTTNLALFSGPAPPNGENFGDTGAGNAAWNTLATKSFAVAGTCKYLDQLQETAIKNYYVQGIVASQLDTYSSGWTFNPAAEYAGYGFKKS